MLIGITGGIGAGKSYVARQLAPLLEAPLFNADDICRELLEPGQSGYEQVVARWGRRFLDADSLVDRPLLRKVIGEDHLVREQLEAILHPLVRERLDQESAALGTAGFLIAEVPLLYESGWQGDFDWIVSVYAPTDLAAERVAKRDGISREEARRIISIQLVPEVKRDRADSVIENAGNLLDTEKQVVELAGFLRQRFAPVMKAK